MEQSGSQPEPDRCLNEIIAFLFGDAARDGRNSRKKLTKGMQELLQQVIMNR